MKYKLPVLLMLMLAAASCRKGPGEGGNSSIRGYVHVQDYNASQVVLLGEYPGVDEWVYIIYGDDISYGDRVRSNYEGKFEFKYLRKGDYKVYVYSDDTTLAGTRAVIKNITISKNKETVDAGTFTIIK
jgi:hypothetical protein